MREKKVACEVPMLGESALLGERHLHVLLLRPGDQRGHRGAEDRYEILTIHHKCTFSSDYIQVL